jgi:hypothetical protein
MQAHPNMTGCLAAQSNLKAVNGVDGWIACRRTPYDDYARFWSKAHVHKLVSNLVGQIK